MRFGAICTTPTHPNHEKEKATLPSGRAGFNASGFTSPVRNWSGLARPSRAKKGLISVARSKNACKDQAGAKGRPQIDTMHKSQPSGSRIEISKASRLRAVPSSACGSCLGIERCGERLRERGSCLGIERCGERLREVTDSGLLG